MFRIKSLESGAFIKRGSLFNGTSALLNEIADEREGLRIRLGLEFLGEIFKENLEISRATFRQSANSLNT